ncbi:MAG: methyl-accepting chemotaxis protein [Treponemataceae bacterium]|nr:methyl-accepting chemotaxis protein [Treponemataceae bacterium]
MKKFRFRITLSVKFMFWFAVAFIISGSSLISNIMLPFRNKTKDMINDSLANSANVVIAKVDGFIEREYAILESLALLPQLSDPAVSMEEKAEILSDVAHGKDRYQNIAFYNEKGMSISHEGTPVDGSSRPYFTEAMKGKNHVMPPVINTVDGSLSMFFSVPVFNAQKKVIGVILAVVKGDELAHLVKDVVIGENSHPVIYTYGDGKILSSADMDEVIRGASVLDSVSPEYDAIMARANNRETGVDTFIDPASGKSFLIYYAPVGEGTDWGINCFCPEHDFNGFLDVVKLRGRQYLISNMAFWMIIMAFIVVRNLKKLKVVTKALEEVATGDADLTKRLTIKANDEVGDIVKSFNSFTEKLAAVIREVKDSQVALSNAGAILQTSTTETASSITEIIANIDSVNNQILRQNGSVQQTSTAVNEIAANIQSLGRMIEVQGNGVADASSAVEQMIGNIGSVNHSVEMMANSFNNLLVETQNGAAKQDAVNEQIKQIESQSEMLQEANEAIAAIASQTNLLAMNAAIEAAHAGESGKGFSVVADEIRKLSETSTAQSQTIGDQLANIQTSILNVVAASQQSSEAFNIVSQKITDTDQLVRQIKSAMEEQQQGSLQIGDALHSMNDNTSEVRQASAEMTAGNEQIVREVNNLQTVNTMITESVDEMSIGAKKINETGVMLSEVSAEVTESINKISDQIGRFIV